MHPTCGKQRVNYFLCSINDVTFNLRQITCNNPSLMKNSHWSSDTHGADRWCGERELGERVREKYEFSVSMLIFLVSPLNSMMEPLS